MRKHFHLAIILYTILLTSCKKDVQAPVADPYDAFNKPYTTGIIKFQYKTPAFFNGIAYTKDTLVEFTSRGANVSEFDDYDYNKASTPWAQLMRRNPADYLNSMGIFFVGTDLNSLILPYKFQATNSLNYAFINYVLGYKTVIDAGGNVSYIGDTYLGTSLENGFELTILSKVNNRLQGTFSGTIKKQDGSSIQVKYGLFDIQIIDR